MKTISAATIYKQIGGNSFKAMVGGYNFVYSQDKNDLKLNKASGKYDEVETFEGLYFDGLESTFERFTGLRTRL